MLKDTFMVFRIFVRTYQRLLFFWFLAFTAIVIFSILKPVFGVSLASKSIQKVFDAQIYFLALSGMGLGFVFNKSRSESWMYRLPVERGSLLLCPLILLFSIGGILFFSDPVLWTTFVGFSERSLILELILLPFLAFALSRRISRPIVFIFGSTTTFVITWLLLGSVLPFLPLVEIINRELVFGGVFLFVLISLEPKAWVSFGFAVLWVLFFVTLPILTQIGSSNKSIMFLAASQTYYESNQSRIGLRYWSQNPQDWLRVASEVESPPELDKAFNSAAVYLDDILNDDEKLIYVQNILKNWKLLVNGRYLNKPVLEVAPEDIHRWHLPIN